MLSRSANASSYHASAYFQFSTIVVNLYQAILTGALAVE